MMHCPSCGHEVADSPFCQGCGKPLTNEKAGPTEPTSDTACGSEPSSAAQSLVASGVAAGAEAAGRSDPVSSRPRWVGLFWATLAVVLYVAVADMAVETFLRESALRWKIAGGAALYLIVCTATWRRMDWAARAATSLVVLTAALAATAWMPDGFERGLSLFGQTTSTLFAVASAVIVALSGLVLARLSFIPMPGKLGVGLLAAYGVAAFLAAVYGGTPYASLFHGGSLWTRLPFWLQGAFVGGLVLAPLALLLQIGSVLRQIAGAKRAEFTFRAIALCMGLLIAVAAVRMPADAVSAATVDSSDRPLVTATDTATAALVGATSSASASMTRMPTVAAPCPANDDLLALEGYAPGAGGTEHLGQQGLGLFGGIAGGTAGDADAPSTTQNCRALAQNVEDAFQAIDNAAQGFPTDGYDVAARAAELADSDAIFAFVRDRVRTQAYAGVMRGAVGTLMSRSGSPADKAVLLAGLLAAHGITVRFVHATLSDADVARTIGAVLAAPAPTRASTSSQMPASPVQDFTGGTNTAQPIAEQIVKSLTRAGAVFASSDAGLRSRWSANLRDHWWVEAQQAQGWVDLDPTLSNASAGSHVGPAPSDAPADQLPDSLYATMSFRVVGDFVDPTGVTTRPMVETQVRAADVYAQPIVVQLGDPQATVKSLAQSTTFTASVSAAGGTASAEPFQPDPDTGARLLRLRLEIETDRPGYPPLVAQRMLIDRSGAGAGSIGAAWDAQHTAYALTATYDGLAVAGELDPAFSAAREVEVDHAVHGLLLFAINRRFPVLPHDGNPRYPVEVMHYLELDGLVRHETEAQSENHTRFYFDRPAIAFVHHGFALKGGRIVARDDFDVVDDAVEATGANVSTAVQDNVVRGVVDDAIEANVLLPKGSVTTRTLFAIASRTGVPIVAVPASGSAPPLPRVARAAATASLQRAAIVATAKAVPAGGDDHVGWWEVDPSTGTTIGRMESGAGQALVEKSMDAEVALKDETMAEVVGGFDRCAFIASNTVLAEGSADPRELHDCEGDVICEYLEDQAVGLFALYLYGEAWQAQEIEAYNKALFLGEKSCK
jgi:transglutaminase-like putative cysteine protease